MAFHFPPLPKLPSLRALFLGAALLAAAGLPARAVPPLQSAPELSEVPPASGLILPGFIQALRIRTRADLDARFEGQVQWRMGDARFFGERLDYSFRSDTVQANGLVRVRQGGNRFEGRELRLKLNAFEGYLLEPTFRLGGGSAHGSAARMNFYGQDQMISEEVRFTTCELDSQGQLEWELRARSLSIDLAEDEARLERPTLFFKETQTLTWPSLTFPLSSRRQSGLLPPLLGWSDQSGVEVTQPLYWNIAPNRDATFSPYVFSARGSGMETEFRFLEPRYAGRLTYNEMPSDTLRNGDERRGLAFEEQVQIAPGVNAGAHFREVSDGYYWSDFANGNPELSERLLARDVSVSSRSGPWRASLLAQNYQTQSTPESVIQAPYARLPQAQLGYTRNDWARWDWSNAADFTRFADQEKTRREGDRTVAQSTAGYRFGDEGWFVTPRLKYHASRYDLTNSAGMDAANYERGVPVYSLDSGLIFEREGHLFDAAYTQTLEPRLYYVLAPYRDQSMLPLFDTAEKDFNFVTIYSDNPYSGADRIADVNQVTAGLVSRFLSAGGSEVLNLRAAQRFRIAEQRVTLDNQPLPAQRSDYLLGSTIKLGVWSLDTETQINQQTGQSDRTTSSLRFAPRDRRALALDYRYQRNSSEQISIAWQTPMASPADLWRERRDPYRWYSLGRADYSESESRLIRGLLGLEYDGCCWVMRVALEQTSFSATQSVTRFIFQVDLVGLTGGSSSSGFFSQNIPGYRALHDDPIAPSRYTRYD